jgi:hypothetical protein
MCPASDVNYWVKNRDRIVKLCEECEEEVLDRENISAV